MGLSSSPTERGRALSVRFSSSSMAVHRYTRRREGGVRGWTSDGVEGGGSYKVATRV